MFFKIITIQFSAFVAPPPITSPMLKPTFKAIVARAMEQQKLAQKQLATANANSVEKGKLSVNNSRANSRRGSGSSTNKSDVNQKLLGECVGKCLIAQLSYRFLTSY